MQRIFGIVALLAAASLSAQELNMTAEDIAAMQKQAQEAQACMEKIDQDRLQQLQTEGEQQIAKVNGLCNAGERDQAQKLAIGYARALMDDPLMKEMQACLGLIKMVLPQSIWAELEKEDTPAHVCDL